MIYKICHIHKKTSNIKLLLHFYL